MDEAAKIVNNVFCYTFFYSRSQRQVPADISNAIHVGKQLIVEEKFSQFILITEIHPNTEKKYFVTYAYTNLSCFIAVNIAAFFFIPPFYRFANIRTPLARKNDGTQLEFNHAKHILLCWQHL